MSVFAPSGWELPIHHFEPNSDPPHEFLGVDRVRLGEDQIAEHRVCGQAVEHEALEHSDVDGVQGNPSLVIPSAFLVSSPR